MSTNTSQITVHVSIHCINFKYTGSLLETTYSQIRYSVVRSTGRSIEYQNKPTGFRRKTDSIKVDNRTTKRQQKR
jgi:hypothetical protein